MCTRVSGCKHGTMLTLWVSAVGRQTRQPRMARCGTTTGGLTIALISARKQSWTHGPTAQGVFDVLNLMEALSHHKCVMLLQMRHARLNTSPLLKCSDLARCKLDHDEQRSLIRRKLRQNSTLPKSYILAFVGCLLNLRSGSLARVVREKHSHVLSLPGTHKRRRALTSLDS